eukprot:TRINITY_DN17614_c0_g1_i4.p1 TRINITY_DN17614_c0_g1~~TRINITY_DN17614_c0_g1_i4.p1  ORF type:complete len:415 (-),score=66.43 TRINITY_DN17614_c0_g1_i4:19-1095(-)
MASESWRMSRTELRDILNKYERAVEDDGYYLLQPSKAERALLGEDLLRRRAQAMKKARDQNRCFVEAVIADLPDLCEGPDAVLVPPRPVAQFRSLHDGVSTLPASSYGSLASVFLHLFRDWSEKCQHVVTSTYAPAIAELARLVPKGGQVLVPGAGLGRLALQLAAEGYKVEANDASRLFLTFADYLLNRAPKDGMPLSPLAHVFSENWSYDQQYTEVTVPKPHPESFAGSDVATVELFPGDFVKTYEAGGPGYRRFDALVTSFFLDTPADVEQLFRVMDALLGEGGVWINIGPLNWRKEARLKLTWEEIVAVWERKGYEFLTQKRAECDYHMPRGEKMYTESYTCSLIAAVKRKSSS